MRTASPTPPVAGRFRLVAIFPDRLWTYRKVTPNYWMYCRLVQLALIARHSCGRNFSGLLLRADQWLSDENKSPCASYSRRELIFYLYTQVAECNECPMVLSLLSWRAVKHSYVQGVWQFGLFVLEPNRT